MTTWRDKAVEDLTADEITAMIRSGEATAPVLTGDPAHNEKVLRVLDTLPPLTDTAPAAVVSAMLNAGWSFSRTVG